MVGIELNCPFSPVVPSCGQALGSACNLNCTYCYYLHKGDLLPETTGGRIADDLLEKFIRQYIAGRTSIRLSSTGTGASRRCWASISIGRSCGYEQKHAGKKRIENDCRRTACCSTSHGASFSRSTVSVGLSIDGPKASARPFRA